MIEPSAFLLDAVEELDPYGERILEAARQLLVEHGLRRTSLSDIARAAGVSDATLYRRFASRDALLAMLVAREARAFIAHVDERISAISDPEERLVIAFVMLTRALREHDLVQRLLVTDRDHVLPLLTTDGAPALTIARQYVLSQANAAIAAGVRLTAEPGYVAELLIRIAHSLVLTPETPLPLENEQLMAELARATLAPMVIAAERA